MFNQLDGASHMSLAVEATGWKTNGGFIQLTGIFSGDAGKWASQGFASIPIGPEAGEIYDKLVEAINEIEELIREYATTKAQMNEKQMIMDLFEKDDFKNTSREELEGLSEAEMLEKAQTLIAKHGGFVMGLDKVKEGSFEKEIQGFVDEPVRLLEVVVK